MSEEITQQRFSRFYKRSGFWATIVFVTGLFAFVVFLNMQLAGNTEKIWIQSEGQLRLSNVASSVENNLAQAESYADSMAAQLELLLDEQGELKSEEIYSFIHSQNTLLSEKTDGNCFSVYVAYKDNLYIENFTPDNHFHLTERTWYVGAKKNQGNIYITTPYVDASTGGMCYTVSMLLDDNETIIGLDFYMDVIQQYIETMSEQIDDGIAMIVNEGGMIVGHTDASLVGEDYTVLADYTEMIDKVFSLYGDYFEYSITTSDGIKTDYTIFSDKTTYGWYLIVCLPSSTIVSGVSTNSLIVTSILLVVWLVFCVIFTLNYRRKIHAQQQLFMRENLLKNITNELRTPVLSIASHVQFSDSADEGLLADLRQETDELRERLDNIVSFQKVVQRKEKAAKKGQTATATSGKYKRYSTAIISILLLASVVSVAVNTYTQLNYVSAYMSNEGEVYYSQAKSWVENNTTWTNELAAHLGAQPDLYQNYEKAVRYLDDVVSENADVSVAYIVNPAWEHEVIMNNGWESDDPDWHVEERDWYVETVLSEDGFNISTPYQDEQTGMYCVTFSQIVYDSEGDIVGLIGVDFYMDSLIDILSQSYTDEGYAFLTDPSYTILNHPSEEYQMSADSSVNGAETIYRDALASETLTIEKDYDGSYTVMLAQREENSGFTVVTVRDFWVIYGTLILTDLVLAVVFLSSIISVLLITRYMSRQQEKLNRELQEAADTAIAAGKAKSSFLAQMSHEIRTPINAVLGMNELILRESTEDAILGYASNAYSSGKALLSIINDVLDISKIEAGRLEIIEAEYDLHSLISDCYHMTSGRAAKKDLAFSVTADETLPAKLCGDMVHLRQIVVNLLTNAIKYTEKGSVEFLISGERKDDVLLLRISVKDTGIGLTEESMSKLFTSFQRFDLKRNQSVEGTGLGLSICKQLAELMGGTVEVQSVYGKGSTFSCRVPQKIAEDTPLGTLALHAPVSHSVPEDEKRFTAPEARILVVDDVEMNLIVFSGLLKNHKMTIDKATSGKQCLQMIKEHTYDVIFMDHMMPEMDGMETFARMQETEHKNPNTPVIMLTANAISGEKEKYLAAGFSDYLTKPIQSAKLDALLVRYLPKEKLVWETAPQKAADETSGEPLSEVPQSADASALDVQLGLRYAGGEEEAYRAILTSYVHGGDDRLQALGAFCESGAWDEYAIQVHALKSTSLTIGARALSEDAAALEKAAKAKDGQTVRERNDALLSLYGHVLAFAKTTLAEMNDAAPEADASAADTPKRELSKEAALAYIARIREAVEGFDADEVIAACGELSGCVCGDVSFADGAAKIKDAIEEFEYEEAAKTAQALADAIGA